MMMGLCGRGHLSCSSFFFEREHILDKARGANRYHICGRPLAATLRLQTDVSDMLKTSLALAVCASAVAMVPTGSLTASMRLRPVAFRCSMSSAADDKNADMMLKLSLNQMESVKGLEGLPEKDANKAISAVKMAAGGEVAEKERKLLNSRRLHEIFIARRDERNEKLAFDTMFNSLQVHQPPTTQHGACAQACAMYRSP